MPRSCRHPAAKFPRVFALPDGFVPAAERPAQAKRDWMTRSSMRRSHHRRTRRGAGLGRHPLTDDLARRSERWREIAATRVPPSFGFHVGSRGPGACTRSFATNLQIPPRPSQRFQKKKACSACGSKSSPYDDRNSIALRDDGKGIDPAVLAARDLGHYGLLACRNLRPEEVSWRVE